jgi:L-alanine-DL-glutamate epimerase-like enolase superfamily enzyme
MAQSLTISRLTIHQLAIPLRQKFKHAAAERACSQPVILALELANHVVGYGETHPREYVTGESIEAVIRTIQEIFIPLLLECRPANFGEVIEFAAALPSTAPDGRVITAARCAVELALLDAYSRAMQKSIASVAGFLSDHCLGPPGSLGTVRFSGVISAEEPIAIKRSLRKMRWFGLRDFKLKVGDADDDQRLQTVIDFLGRPLTRGKVRLRLDANGAWTLDQAKSKLAAWEQFPIASVEQPLPKGQTIESANVAHSTTLPIMADESLVTLDDARELIKQRAASLFNIRISKNGGLIPALQLALLARQHNLNYQLGCMVGETSILSAAGRWFLHLVPHVQFAEGSFGKFLLDQDITTKSLRFGYRGSWAPPTGHGLGIELSPPALDSLAAQKPIYIPL